MGEAAEHIFNKRWAAPALKQAMEDLAQKTGRSIDDLDGITLGEAYQDSLQVYGADLPEYWKVWSSWNDAPDSSAEMGDLE